MFVSILVLVEEASGFHAKSEPRDWASLIMCTKRPSDTTKNPVLWCLIRTTIVGGKTPALRNEERIYELDEDAASYGNA
jgi:hypothetical protein